MWLIYDDDFDAGINDDVTAERHGLGHLIENFKIQ